MRGGKDYFMANMMHTKVVEQVNRAIQLMDDFLRNKIDTEGYLASLKQLDVDEILEVYADDFKSDASKIYYLDALMMLSSLRHELDFQVNEYGASVASEDIKMLKELANKFLRPCQ